LVLYEESRVDGGKKDVKICKYVEKIICCADRGVQLAETPAQQENRYFMLQETWIKKIISELCEYQKQFGNVF